MSTPTPTRSAPIRLSIGLLRRSARALAYALVGGFVVLLVGGVRVLNSRPDLRPWHLAELDAEFRTDSPVQSFAEYLELETRLFAQLDEQVLDQLQPEDQTRINRFHRGSIADPGRWPKNWNRSFELPTTRPPRAGVLLLHGLTDSPYSLRHIGRALHEGGAWVLALRVPGHGTAPSGLVETRWQDMAAAARLAVRHLDEQVGNAPLFVVGYSNGAALAVEYALAALEEPTLPRVQGLVLLSPAIGVTRLAALAVWQARLGHLLRLPKLEWSSILLEYDPFKYNSFAIHAGDLTYRLTSEIRTRIERLAAGGGLADFPPVLAFQSLTDATVSTRAVIDVLFLRLPEGGHELVLFDVNRVAVAEDLLSSDPKTPIAADLTDRRLDFAIGLVTNESEASEKVVWRRKRAGGSSVEEQTLGLAWPAGVYSLAHVSLPFPPDDPLYGGADAPPSPGIAIGRAELRGERGFLRIGATDLIRLRWNPFYPWVEARIVDTVTSGDVP